MRNYTKNLTVLLVLISLLLGCGDSYNVDLQTSQLDQEIITPSSKLILNESANTEIKLALAFKVQKDVDLQFDIDDSSGDFNKQLWTVTVPKGQKIISTTLEALADDSFEPDEDFILTISDPTKTVLKKPQTFTIIIPAAGNAAPADDFISRWTFASNNYSFTLPIKADLNYNFTIDWGDGSPLSVVTSFADIDKSHTYASLGTYTITVSGLCEGFQNDSAHRDELIEVVNLGDMGWKSFRRAFRNNSNLISVSGGNTSEVTDMSSMFDGATNVVVDTLGWTTTNVTDMSGMFSNTEVANPDVSNWDTSKVIYMGGVFSNTKAANPDVSNWDTSEVTSLASMFFGAEVATPDVTNWTTSKVDSLVHIFWGATLANPNLINWDFSAVDDRATGRIFTSNPNLSVENYSNFLIAASTTGLMADPGRGNKLADVTVQYNAAAAAARADLVGNLGWSITDGGPE